MLFKYALKRTAFLCLFLAIGSSLYAQTITGTVTDARTGEPLAGANIVQAGTTNGVSADAEGKFAIDLVEGESAVIEITFVGYETQKIDITEAGRTLEIRMKPRAVISNEIFVRALRVDESSPMAYENISRAEIEEQNLGQDMPYLIGNSQSVTTTSDAGAGIGYTSMRIRGVDQGRINVTINGIPLNDAESHGVFWVNIPDLASSVENIQLQRGVGTSTQGAAAFGATMNIQTSQLDSEPYGEVNTAAGSFNTRKVNVKLGSGLMDNGWQFEGRLSKIESDGYIDRAFSDLKSFFLSAARHGDRSLLRADLFSGREHTYQAWYGVPEEMLETNRTFNPAGTEKPGDPYDNQTDNYQQDHYQLHYSYQLTDNWYANASLHYTYGRGFFEEYHADEALIEYNIDPIQIGNETIEQSNLVRQLWLDNHFYGMVFSTDYEQSGNWKLTVGGGYNEYDGDHFGEVVWAQFLGESEVNNRYYDNNAFKTDFNTYIKGHYYLTENLSAFVDAQIRRITYNFLGVDRQPVPGGGQEIVDVRQRDELTFFNPKAGVVYRFDSNQRAYASFSVGNKEPTRDEYVNSTPENRPGHETLYDWEAGYRGSFSGFSFGINTYYMKYRHQLILTGEINDVGAYIRQNVPDSYRAGIEIEGGVRLSSSLEWEGNVTVSRNKIDEYTYFIDNFDTGQQETVVYEDVDIAFSPDFIGNSELQFRKDGFSAALRTKYVSRQYLDNTQTSGRSLDPYFINDLRLGYSWRSVPLANAIETTLQINNVFDQTYESNGYTFGFISGGEEQYFNYYYPQAGRNFLLQLSFKF